MSWEDGAACRGPYYDPKWWDEADGPSADLAIQICSLCEVKAQCLEFAVSGKERFGIWGGMTPRQRDLLMGNKVRRDRRWCE